MPESGTYLFGMPPSSDVRRLRFATFVRRVLESATARGITVKQIEERTNVSKSTFYRWRDGNWARDPEMASVRQFCEGLGVPRADAFRALGWDDERPQATPPPPMDPDFEVLLRRLADPTVSDREKFLIRETIRALVARTPGRRSKSGRVDQTG